MAGVLWVSSRILELEKLSVEDFDEWYEEEHAPEILSLPGVPSATRYYSTSHSTSPHLITYSFPSLSYATSPAFTAIAATPPSPSLVEKIYANTTFDIRFYASFAPDVQSDAGPATLLANVEFSPLEGKEGDFEVWFAGKLALDVKNLKGFVGLRRLRFMNGVVRERNVVAVEGKPGWSALVGFDGTVHEEETRGELERALGEGVQCQVGWYVNKRMFGEEEWGHVGTVERP